MICSPAGAHHRRWSSSSSQLIKAIAIAAFVVIATGSLAPSAARAQSLGIPVEAKKSNDMTAYKAAIEQVLSTAVGQLADPSADVQSKTRMALENECKITGSQDLPTPAYLDFYARTLNKLFDTLKDNPSVRIRMNAALAACNVAAIAGNDGLKDAIINFVNDKNPAVVLWGIKGAKYIIAAQLRGVAVAPFNPALVNAIINAVKTHTEGAIAGAIAAEAYDALTLDISNNPQALAKMQPVMLKTIAPFVIQLLQTRIAMYQKGVPPTPRADAWGTRFLTDPAVWALLNVQQRLDAMQAFVNLVTLAGSQAANANPGDKTDLIVMIARAASAISTVVTDPAVKPVLDPLVALKPQVPGPQVKQLTDALLAALKKVKDYAGLKDVPPIIGHEAAPAPASAPTTGPVEIPGGIPPMPPPTATPPTPTTKRATAPTSTPPAPRPTTPAPTTPPRNTGGGRTTGRPPAR